MAALGLALFTLMLLSAVPACSADAEFLDIETKTGMHRFEVEVATTPSERSKGLMFRRRLADDRGMLFDFGRDEFVTMWMRNTYVSLDMIFAFADGTIHRIESQTEPFSERTIPSGVPVRYVLEVRGGRTGELGVAAGDRIVSRRIEN